MPASLARAGTARGDTASLLALGAAGLCTFLNVYAAQPLLPLLGRAFAAGKAEVAWTVSAPALAVAIASPFAGAAADRVGRRRLMVLSLFALTVPTALAASARTLSALVAWRFLQGVAVPGVYAVGLSYIAEVWQGRGVGRAMSALVTGNVIGGFLGRVVAGACAEVGGWRAAFVALAALTAVGAAAAARWLPPEPPARPAPRASPLAGLRAVATHLDAQLLAAFAVGFSILFGLVATFTYVSFHLAAPPFRLGAAVTGSLFVTYLVGAVVTPLAGPWIDRVGARRALSASIAVAVAGGLLTLAPSLVAIGIGLAAACTAAFVAQATATSHLQVAAPREARAAASGLYVSAYYLGGSVGGVLPAAAWRAGGWTACVALVAAVQLAALLVALRCWSPPGATARAGAPLADDVAAAS